jgi:hypothetical protein
MLTAYRLSHISQIPLSAKTEVHIKVDIFQRVDLHVSITNQIFNHLTDNCDEYICILLNSLP